MEQKLKLEIFLLLPEATGERDQCVERLQHLLQAKAGVNDAHAVVPAENQPAQLCIHYDPDRFSLAEIRQLARQAGTEVTQRYGHLFVRTQSIWHTRQARRVSESLRGMRGVLEAEASADGLIRIEFDRDEIQEVGIRGRLNELGVEVVRVRPPGAKQREEPVEKEHEHGGLFDHRFELLFALLAGFLLLVGWIFEVSELLPGWVPLALYVVAYLFGGFFILREAIQNLAAKRFEIDFLMLFAAVGAAVLGKWAEGALLLFLFGLGHALEHFAMNRARRAIESLSELAPKTAIVKRDGEQREVSVEELEIGDVVVVQPNSRIPADAVVVRGTSSVDQSPVTGESVPVDKQPVDDREAAVKAPSRVDPTHRVFAGTINGNGALEVAVTQMAKDSTLARVVQMVAEAETQKSPTQRFADRFERIFVPSVLAFVVLLLFAWVVIDESFGASFYRAMAVLVAASPCALAIATPSAVLSAVARAGRGGVLVKGGGPLENLGTLRAIAFDKTGTLTEGKPRVTDVVAWEGATEEELLSTAVAVETLSDHPLAAAVVHYGRLQLDSKSVPEARDLESVTGRGVKATLDGEPVYVGKDDLFAEIGGSALPEKLRRTVTRLEKDGRTTMIVRHGERYLGVLGLMDTPRESAAPVIEQLRQLGIRRMVMISGDNQRVVEAVADRLGLDDALGDLLPEDKVQAIKSLRKDGEVAMVGDGVNDAPAMAHATVGIAMGAAGSDVALETADVALMADDLTTLPFAVGLSRKTSRVIKQNLWLSLGMVAFLIPATILGLRIGPAVALHEGSTLIVVFNALRLLAYRTPKISEARRS